jgi:preprotein translocase subunit SecE
VAASNSNLARKKSGNARSKSTADGEKKPAVKLVEKTQEDGEKGASKAVDAKKTAATVAAINKANAGEPGAFKLRYDAVVRFLKSVHSEMERVTWPSWKELRMSTVVVVATLLLVSLYMGVVDWVLSIVFGTPATGF